jgi:aspartyl-tRNA(Asn)/glutamyl-tRNA(Gln) amidotransferase subunit C
MLSKEEIRHIARLARIRLTPTEEEKYRKDLSQVLDFFRELESVDTAGVGSVGMITGKENAYRSDTLTPAVASTRQGILDQFPKKQGESLQVPSVF